MSISASMSISQQALPGFNWPHFVSQLLPEQKQTQKKSCTSGRRQLKISTGTKLQQVKMRSKPRISESRQMCTGGHHQTADNKFGLSVHALCAQNLLDIKSTVACNSKRQFLQGLSNAKNPQE